MTAKKSFIKRRKCAECGVGNVPPHGVTLCRRCVYKHQLTAKELKTAPKTSKAGGG